jgi:hypothetical protein
VRLEGHHDLPGVLGEDPRGRASEELGRRGVELAAERAAAALTRALATDDVRAYAEALRASVRALERLWRLRQELPRERVPPVPTPAWIRHLEAVREGDWERARAAAEEKLGDPAR